MRIHHILFALSVFVAPLFSSVAFAGGPFIVDSVNNTGVAARWQNDTVTWWADGGTLPKYADNAAAVDMLEAQFDKWVGATLENAAREDVSTAKLRYSANVLGGDVHVDNYVEHCYGSSAAKTCIIFDSDGTITDDLMGEGASDYIVGLSQPLMVSANGLYITKGIIILNGSLLESGALTTEQFEPAVLHEIGHLINLDHTQISHDLASNCQISKPDQCVGAEFIPTMYPELVTKRQGDLTRDDVITLSWIYPRVSDSSHRFHQDFSTITGEIFDKDGKPMKGVNVIAMRADEGSDMARRDAMSMVSGVLYPGYTGDSRYYLYGLKPGAKYTVTAEPISAEFTGASGFEPIPDPPQGFDAMEVSTPGGDETVTAPDAGGTLEMAALTIDQSRCPAGAACGYDGDSSSDGTQASSSTKCSLTPYSPFDASSSFGVIALLVSAGLITLRRRNI